MNCKPNQKESNHNKGSFLWVSSSLSLFLFYLCSRRSQFMATGTDRWDWSRDGRVKARQHAVLKESELAALFRLVFLSIIRCTIRIPIPSSWICNTEYAMPVSVSVSVCVHAWIGQHRVRVSSNFFVLRGGNVFFYYLPLRKRRKKHTNYTDMKCILVLYTTYRYYVVYV